MDRSKTFFAGLAAGILAMALAFAGYGAYGRFVRWGGLVEPSKKVGEILALLDAHSINEYDADELLGHMYAGLLDGVGDPYTYYYDETAFADFKTQSDGRYSGVGMLVETDAADGFVTVSRVYPETPAWRAGILKGDKITAVDGTDAVPFELSEVTGKTKGEPGTQVVLTIYRPSEGITFDAEITREIISVPTVYHRMLEDGIGYIQIVQFDRATLGQFEEAYGELKSGGMRGLILDLRDNPGGLLETVVAIADILLPEGVITYTEDKSGERKYYRSNGTGDEIKAAVLINGGSASASEVLSLAARELGGAMLFGSRTFGKGIVQNVYALSDGSAVKMTVSKYYSQSGVCIQGEGIIPDFIVGEDGGTPQNGEDACLLKALEVLRGVVSK